MRDHCMSTFIWQNLKESHILIFGQDANKHIVVLNYDPSKNGVTRAAFGSNHGPAFWGCAVTSRTRFRWDKVRAGVIPSYPYINCLGC